MIVEQIYTHSHLRNFTYLIGNAQQQYWCIDPFDGEQIAQWLTERGASLRGIINTHEHDDHTCGNLALLAATGCTQVWGHPACGHEIPGYSGALVAGDLLPVDDHHQLKVMDTPGHAQGHVCLLLEKIVSSSPIAAEKLAATQIMAVFSGDILFNAGVGHCRRKGANVEGLYHTIAEQFGPLPDHTLVYPGHEYLSNNLNFSLSLEPNNQTAKQWLARCDGHDWGRANIVTTMGDEREFNPFLRLNNATLVENLQPPGTDEKSVFVALRARRDHW